MARQPRQACAKSRNLSPDFISSKAGEYSRILACKTFSIQVVVYLQTEAVVARLPRQAYEKSRNLSLQLFSPS